MIEIKLVIYLLVFHWIGDFYLQSEKMSKRKSSCNTTLFGHVLVYTLVLLFTGSFFYAVFNGLIHFAVDWKTSRITTKLWEDKKVHNFFVMIGVDQFIHVATLILTAPLFLY